MFIDNDSISHIVQEFNNIVLKVSSHHHCLDAGESEP